MLFMFYAMLFMFYNVIYVLGNANAPDITRNAKSQYEMGPCSPDHTKDCMTGWGSFIGRH